MKIVNVRFKGSDEGFWFTIPDKLAELIQPGIGVVCQTKYGKKGGRAVSCVMSGPDNEEVQNSLDSIVGVYGSVNLDSLKLMKHLQGSIPHGKKIQKRVDEFREYKEFRTEVIVKDGVLVDGYSAWLVCKMLDRSVLKWSVGEKVPA